MRHNLPMNQMNFLRLTATNMLTSAALAASSALLLGVVSSSTWAQASPAQTITAPTKPAKATFINRVVVVVNDDVITQVELNDRIEAIERRLKAQGTALPSRDELQKQILERMIIDRTQIQLAKEQGMRVDDINLDRSLQRMAEQNKISLQEMRNQIEREGTSFAVFREEIRDDITMQRIREREVDSKIQVSELEVDNFLAAQANAPSTQQEINLGHIMVRIPENATPEIIAQRNARAQEAHKKLRIGEDFAKLAATYSDSTEALTGGEVGWREQDKIPPLFVDAISKLPNGGISAVVKSPNGFHILKLLGKRAMAVVATPTAVQETNVRHIVMKPTQLVTATQVKATLADLKQRIINKTATFEELAKTYSVDSSASKGGALGWIHTGDTMPEFEQVMNKLAFNEVSDPVETQLGFHLIQVTERKTSEDSKERKRLEARQSVRARKAEEALQDWLRQLRDRAYVEFRLEEK